MAQKQDFPALLPAGIHSLTLRELEALAVKPFPNDIDRMRLFTLFTLWAREVQALNVSCIVWIDGSFLTQKQGPGDIDCVAWNPHSAAKLTGPEQAKIKGLFLNSAAKAQYGLDLYLVRVSPDKALHEEAYWRGLFGFQHNGKSAKGFVELKL